MSRVVPESPTSVTEAARTLRSGGLVAFPTETVYGLGAAARDPEALARLYRAKGRPSHHPVIVHLPSAGSLGEWAEDVPEPAQRLAEAHWPGPLTLVLRRAPTVPDAVTGGQDTVGVRVPAHPLALALLAAYGDGIAAPSANRFGRVSPTTALHVAEEFVELDLKVLDGGPSSVGVESTIVDLSGAVPTLLRPGGIALEVLEATLGGPLAVAPHLLEASLAAPRAAAPRAPGSLPRHYAPETPSVLVAAAELTRLRPSADGSLAVLARCPAPTGWTGAWLELPDDPVGYARGLYAALRRLDAGGWARIVVEAAPSTPAWLAVRDRLRRATTAADGRERLVGARQEGR